MVATRRGSSSIGTSPDKNMSISTPHLRKSALNGKSDKTYIGLDDSRGSKIQNVALLAALLGPAIGFLLAISTRSFEPLYPNARHFIAYELLLGFLGCLFTIHMVGFISAYCRRKGQVGKDLCKRGTPAGEVELPESQGLAPGIIFMIIIIGFQLIHVRDSTEMVNYNSSLLSICFMLLLGFADDVLDLPWRYKLILPPIATLPLLCSYSGSTAFIVPRPLRHLICHRGRLTPLGSLVSLIATVDLKAEGKIIDLGPIFMLYMALLAVFCTNAINIYAGINGLEAGQSLVIAMGILGFKLYDILYENDGQAGSVQIFSLTLLIPFVSVIVGLLYHNFYPARAFVGDTFCYFAGMTFAVIGIHGHFSKTLFLLFGPQVLNFLLSIPQLFKLVPCPRHRLPTYDATLDRLTTSTHPCLPSQYTWIKRIYGLPSDSDFFINLTLINLVLRVLGPTHERTLCLVLLSLQAVCCLIVLILRFHLAHAFL